MKCERGGLSLLLLAVLLLVPVTARAERIERVFPASGDTVLEVRNLSGQLRLQAWNRPQVQVVALRRSLMVETHFEQTANRIHIHTHLLQAEAPANERVVDYEIWAPPQARLQLNQETGTVRVEGFGEDVSIETLAAAVVLRHLSGRATVQTLNGSIQAERCWGRVEAKSISGSLRFVDLESPSLLANTTSGDIFYEGDFARGGSYDFTNHEGAIELWLPATASFELDAKSVKGEVVNELPLTPRTHGRVPERSAIKSLLGTVHTGDALVRATSFSGTIRVRKR